MRDGDEVLCAGRDGRPDALVVLLGLGVGRVEGEARGGIAGKELKLLQNILKFFEIHSTHCPQIYMKPGLDRRKTRRSRSLPLA